MRSRRLADRGLRMICLLAASLVKLRSSGAVKRLTMSALKAVHGFLADTDFHCATRRHYRFGPARERSAFSPQITILDTKRTRPKKTGQTCFRSPAPTAPKEAEMLDHKWRFYGARGQ